EAYADSVAEFALGLMILARRRAFASDRIMRQGGWGTTARPRGWRGALDRIAPGLRPDPARGGLEPPPLKAWRGARPVHGIGSAPPMPARELKGSVVGLIGWGSSARALARRLGDAEAQVIAWSDHAETDDIEAAGARRASLAEALAADLVSLHRG